MSEHTPACEAWWPWARTGDDVRRRVVVMTTDGVTHYKVTYVRFTLCSRTSNRVPLTDVKGDVTCMRCIAYAETLDVGD